MRLRFIAAAISLSATRASTLTAAGERERSASRQNERTNARNHPTMIAQEIPSSDASSSSSGSKFSFRRNARVGTAREGSSTSDKQFGSSSSNTLRRIIQTGDQQSTFYPTLSPSLTPSYAYTDHPTSTTAPSAPSDPPTLRPYEIVSSSKPSTPNEPSTVIRTSEPIMSMPTTAPTSPPASLEPTSAPTLQPNTSTPATFKPSSTPTFEASTSKPTTSKPSSTPITTPKPTTSNLTLTPTTAPSLSITTEDSITPQSECQAITVECGPSKTCTDAGDQNNMCCSQWGYCGQGADFCGSCCQNGLCSSAPAPTPTQRPESSVEPSLQPAAKATSICTTSFTIETYDSIDADIATLKEDISDDEARAHFLGGIVRLAAHDFMDYNPTLNIPMGPDGCFDTAHPNNAGLETIWCDDCDLTELHREKYSHISRADFWVACANAVIRQTSVGNALDLIETYRWGRIDAVSCSGSGERLPTPSGCTRVERVFLENMGLSWRDTVALLGAHTLGRGSRDFSGHNGTWKDSNQDAQVFDKQYYAELLDNTWRIRNQGGPSNGSPPQDWTTGSGDDNGRMMLNTDICLVYNIDVQVNGGPPCCTHTDMTNSDGSNHCPIPNVGDFNKCPFYADGDSRRPALEAVDEFYSGGDSDFYDAFADAWGDATTVGQSSNLKILTESCI